MIWWTLVLAASPLSLDEVLHAVQESHPEIEAAGWQMDAAAGRSLAADGGFDPTLRIDTDARPLGPYQNGSVDAEITQPTSLWGLKPWVGYRLGQGRFQSYKEGLATEELGELRAGIELPFWRGGPIDKRRAEIRIARAGVNVAQCDARATGLRVDRRAAEAYWTWVASGQQVRVQEELYKVAQDRQKGLASQAKQGNVPRILVVDNERLVLDRESKLVAARRRFQDATTNLSLYLRDDEAQTIRASMAALPDAISHPEELELLPLEEDLASAVQLRPEVCSLQNRKSQARTKLDLAKNNVGPKLNTRAYVSQDFVSSGAAPDTTEVGVGLKFEMPLLLREARGETRNAKAKTLQVEAKLRGTVDAIRADIMQARIDLTASHDQVLLSRRQMELARRLANAERRKLAQGASDLVIVNLRELAAAEAARLNVASLAAYRKSEVKYEVATGRGLRKSP